MIYSEMARSLIGSSRIITMNGDHANGTAWLLMHNSNNSFWKRNRYSFHGWTFNPVETNNRADIDNH
jgi:hypothetical protein